MYKLAMLLLVMFLGTSGAQAACNGSGATWSCTAGSSAADINAAISKASDGATITLASGTYSFTGISLNPRNGVTIKCESVRACTISSSGSVFAISTGPSIHITNLMRISGFVFSSSTGGNPTISIGFAAGDPWVDKLRIDNCTFNQTQGIAIATGHTASTRRVNGVIDHNIFQGSTHNYPLMIFGAGDNDWNSGSLQGKAENLFVEDNVFNYASENLSASGMDSWNGGRLVVRYNSIKNARVAVHGVCHGGPSNLEVYKNTIANTSADGGYRIIHHQGSGEFMVFNNSIDPETSTIALLNYRSSNPNPEGCGVCDGTQSKDGNRLPTTTYRGYPCYRQPGRTGDASLRPIYLWNNKFASSGKEVFLRVESAGGTSLLGLHVVRDRDYYEVVSNSAQASPTSPFDGARGMGFGTLANRPTTCTTNSLESGGGVGYWATDTNTLYRCSATNTWIAHYTPYTYPHPLTQAEDVPQEPSPLEPPRNLHVQ